MAKCENCYHAGVCLHRINYEDYDCECANYKDNSLIVELPCRVGDTVYMIDALGKIDECIIEEICTNPFNNIAVLRRTKGVRNRIGTYFKYFGKTVFLSREEAERALEALEEREKNG